MRTMVVGAAGMLGQAIVSACARRGHEVIGLGKAQLDITDGPALDRELRRSRPDAVINCAAFSDVDGAEDDERAAMRVNDEGAGMLAASAASVGASIVYPSSDYVFDGSKRTPYVESDLTAPISAYGRSKLAGETSVSVSNREHFIVRTSWLFGQGGKNFVETMLRIGVEQREVLVVSDQRGCPTATVDLAEAIAALAESEDYGIHHITGSGACTWFDFAQEIFDQAGYETKVMSGTTEMLARKAPRPAYSVLGSERPNAPRLAAWQDSLRRYIADRELAGSSLPSSRLIGQDPRR